MAEPYPILPLHFAYGAHLDPTLMGTVCPAHRYLCRALLPDYALRFQGWSARWGGATATIRPTPGATVHGVVFELTPADFDRLDRAEGYGGPGLAGNVADRIAQAVRLENGETIEAQAYVLRPAPPGAPSRAYRWAMLVGMRRHALPATAIAAVEAEPTVD